MKPIPISAATYISKKYDYDQVIIIARKTGDAGGEHVTTYGINKEHCKVAAHCGKFIKEKVMMWESEPVVKAPPKVALAKAELPKIEYCNYHNCRLKHVSYQAGLVCEECIAMYDRYDGKPYL